ncbi:MAG: ATP-binding protein [Desulfovibrionaceae bacterium]
MSETGMDKLRCRAEMQSLETLLEFVSERAGALGLPPELDGKVRLVLEELLVNVISYAYPDGNGDVEIECGVSGRGAAGHRFTVRLRDWGQAFDPLGKQTPDISAGVDERPIGGLGIMLAVEMSDHLAYAREGDVNMLEAAFDYGDAGS